MIYSLMNVMLLLMIQFFIPFQPLERLFLITFLNLVSFGVLIATKTSKSLDFQERVGFDLLFILENPLSHVIKDSHKTMSQDHPTRFHWKK